MQTYKQAREKPDFTVLCIDPGWVKTGRHHFFANALASRTDVLVLADMGGDGAILEPEESVSGILKVITTKTNADSGKFFKYDGSVLPY